MRDKVWGSTASLFKWRFSSRRRCRCLSYLIEKAQAQSHHFGWPAPTQTSYFIGPYNLHFLLFSGTGALLFHPYCFQIRAQTLFGIGEGCPHHFQNGAIWTPLLSKWVLLAKEEKIILNFIYQRLCTHPHFKAEACGCSKRSYNGSKGDTVLKEVLTLEIRCTCK